MSFFLLLAGLLCPDAAGKKAQRTIVLSFDDAPRSHYTFVAPLLRKYKFGATFYVCEYPGFENKEQYMTWEQIGAIGRMGFEIGNHTRTHKHVNRMREEEFHQELEYIEKQCEAQGLPRPTTFAYPGYDHNRMAQDVLRERGYTSARAGEERTFDPAKDTNPMLLPSYTIKGDSLSTLEQVKTILENAAPGTYPIFCFHGIPDLAHDWVTTSPDIFREIVKYLRKKKYEVISVGEFTRRMEAGTL